MLLLILGQAPSNAERGRDVLALPVTLPPGRARDELVLPAQLKGQRPRDVLTLSAILSRSDLRPAVLPAPELPAGDVVVPPAPLFMVTHGGLMRDAIDYSLGMTQADDGTRKPTLRVKVRGEYLEGETFNVLVTAQSPTGHGSFGQMYGPFMITGRSDSQAASGLTTDLTSTDTTAADAELLEAMGPLQYELLPWEAEKGVTPREQAEVQRNKALEDRARQKAVAGAKCSAKNTVLRDGRSAPVNTLIATVLDLLPIPYVLTAPLPYRGSFYAETDTGRTANGGELLGTSYQTYNKRPLEILRDLLGRVGWRVMLRDGLVYLGPPEPLSPGRQASAEAMGVPLKLLTAVSRDYINTSPKTSRMTTPRQYVLQGAKVRRYIPPLDPEDDKVLSFEADPNGILEDVSQGWRDLARTVPDYVTRTFKRKKAGNLIEERVTTATWVPLLADEGQDISVTGSTGESRQKEYWDDRANDRVIYTEFRHPLFPHAETYQVTHVTTPVQLLGKSLETETTTISYEWHDEGWLRRKVTSITKLDGWQKISHETDSVVGGVITSSIFPITYYTTEEEEWTPLGGGKWAHVLTRKTLHMQPIIEDGLIVGYQPVAHVERIPDDATPPTTEQANCADEENKGYPYEDPITLPVDTHGRADPVTVDIPWEVALKPEWVDWILAASGNRPCVRVTYSLPVPPRMDTGGVVKSLTGNGKAGSFQGQVAVEEMYVPKQ